MASDVANMQMVAVRGGELLILAPRVRMTMREALVHAAWLVALNDQQDEFDAILREVLET